MKSKQQRIAELMNAIDRNNLRKKGISLAKFVKQDFTTDKPKTDLDRKFEMAMYNLQKLQLKMYAENRIK